jgi:subtilisin family serine protease
LLGLARIRTTVRVAAFGLLALLVGRLDEILAGSVELRPREESPATPGGGVEPTGDRRLHLVELDGPVDPGRYDALARSGVRIVSYVSDNRYLVYGDRSSLAALRKALPSLLRDDLHEVSTAFVGSAPAATGASGSSTLAIQLVEDTAANAATLALIDHARTGPTLVQFRILGYVDIVVPVRTDAIPSLAARPDVVAIAPYADPVMHDERQDQIVAGNLDGNVPAGPGFLAWLGAHGFDQAQFDGSGFVVDLSDSGVDDGTPSPNHFGLHSAGIVPGTSRVAYTRLAGTPNPGSTLSGCDGHGTINAHIVAGYDDSAGFPFADPAGFHYGLGVCPFVRIGSSVVFDPGWTHPSYPDLVARAYASGARIGTNSWGFTTSAGGYDMVAQAYDALVRDAQPASSALPAAGNQEMSIVFSAGNAGPGAGTISRPGTAKNVITVGAAENVHPFGGADACLVRDLAADSANDLASFSGRGPCTDGRHKPDIVAPGTHVGGGVVQAPSPPPNGQSEDCFTGVSVCGGPNADLYWPSGQQWYTASSGTSHAAPAVAGGAALVRQHFLNRGLAAPSPAMTKAYLLGSARYLDGAGGADSLWSNAQGMGELDLGGAFDGAARVLRDQLPADTLQATGDSRTFTGTIADPSKPLRVTLVWTDAPGSLISPIALMNDLDLVVTAGGRSYLGNVFAGPFSTTGGTRDSLDNVESVFLPAGLTGPVAISVRAANITSDGVPGEGGPLDQDFALVGSNLVEGPLPVVAPIAATLAGESCSPGNGAVDPGETVTLELALGNVGTADTSALVATLLEGGGIVPITRSAEFGRLAASGPGVSLPFQLVANGACGGSAVATLSLSDGDRNLGLATFTIPFASPASCCRGTGPKPVPDGRWVVGEAMRVVRGFSPGSPVHLSWDVSGCAAPGYLLASGRLASLSVGRYDEFVCALGSSGSADVELDSGDRFFVIVPFDANVAGSFGRDDSGRESRGNAAGSCGIKVDDPSGLCP